MMDGGDQDQGGGNSFDEAEAAFFGRGGGGRGCCFFPCWPSSSSSSAHQRIGGAQAAGADEKERRSWWRGAADAVLKVREWSELAAGPRWKTFIRRFGRGNGAGGPRNFGGGRKLNYDALSYALNFDDGPGATPDPGADHQYRDFSSRFAALPTGSAKSSMDLGGRDAPPLFFSPPPPIVQA